MKNIISSIAALFVFSLSFCLYAAGISTGFSEVRLENLRIGISYSVKKTANMPLVIMNTGSNPIDLKVELLAAEPAELKEGFLPIPDLSWVKLERRDFKDIKPGAEAVTDVIISIPQDKKYQGKKYQLFIWSHTVGKAIGIGLKSKLIFTIAQE